MGIYSFEMTAVFDRTRDHHEGHEEKFHEAHEEIF
jgi:hypothetical protein